MKPAANKMEKEIQKVNFQDLSIQLVSNVTAKPTKSSVEIKKLLVEQIFSKVRWRESVEFMIKNDVKEFIEIITSNMSLRREGYERGSFGTDWAHLHQSRL